MPIAKINMLKGKSPLYKKTLLDCVHQGLVESLHIEDWDRFQRIIEFNREDFEMPDFIELSLFPGRTKEEKKNAIETITEKLTSSLGVNESDIFIIMNEPPLENWGMAGKQKG